MKTKKIKMLNFMYISFSLYMCIYLAQKFVSNQLNNISLFLCSFLLLIAIQVFLYIGLRKIIQKNLTFEKLYLICAIFFGIFFLFSYVPCSIPDEPADFGRTYEITEGHLTSQSVKGVGVGSKQPSNIARFLKTFNSYGKFSDAITIKLNKETKFYDYATKALYSFVSYIPQAIGMTIAKVLNLPIFFLFILAKLGNYIFFVTLLYLSIKYIPFKKEFLFFLALLPEVMQEAISLSPDAMTIATSIALLSFILYFRYGTKELIKKWQLLLLTLLAITLSLCKIVYLPLCLFLFFIPKERFHSAKEKWLYTFFICAVAGIFNLIWLSISSSYLSAFSGRSNSAAQLVYIFQNPLKYGITIFKTLDTYLYNYLLVLTGGAISLNNIATPSIFFFASIVLLCYLIGKKKGKDSLFNKGEKIMISGIILIVLLLICTSLYLQWNRVGNDIIDGIQGRYFIPLLLPCCLLFVGNKNIEKETIQNHVPLILFNVFFNISGLIAIITNFL